MRSWSALPRPFLATLAGILAFAAALYGSFWMYAVRNPGPLVELGFNVLHNSDYDAKTHSIVVKDVIEGSPAKQAGLLVGDRITGVNGRVLAGDLGRDESYVRGRPGDMVTLTVVRPGQPQPLLLHGIFRPKSQSRPGEGGVARSSALQVIGLFPIPFLAVGFAVLFSRLEEPRAWLLALLFCAFIGAPDLVIPSGISSALPRFAFAFRAISLGMLGPLFYLFFAEFPSQSPLDRRFPWLKWLALAFGMCISLPGLRAGHPSFPRTMANWIGINNADLLLSSFLYGLFALGIIALSQNSFKAEVPPEARRKSRVILWGTIAGVLPIVLERGAEDFSTYHPSFWFDFVLLMILFLYPLSFAYALVKHRVLDIPVLLRRSARYVLVQRGFVVLLFIVAIGTMAFLTRVLSRVFEPNVGTLLSGGLGIALVWISAPLLRRGAERIDRAFFRSAYDTRVILQELAEKIRTVTNRHELARLLELRIDGALHPKSLACYLDAGDRSLVAEGKRTSPHAHTTAAALPHPKFPFRSGTQFVLRETNTIPATMPLLMDLAQAGKAWDVPAPVLDEAADSTKLAPECLVPILGRNSALFGLLVLGQRRSEEPYSSEDKNLLDSVASQAGIALENIRLAEKMAERIEADRRMEREMEIAREVQGRLFPQKLPTMKTLEYMGGCIPARAVGGDYYDFLELRGGHLALVLADVSGKGVSGALLMANLQANLRSQCAMGIDDLRRVLASVNRSFCENTGDANYATLFFADYEDSSRTLRYANCGHLPPLLLGADGSLADRNCGAREVQRLDATCTVLGLFERWECQVAEVALAPGDTLVLYTDGITEAQSADGEEFGETRLLETLRNSCHLPVQPLIQAVVEAVQQFTGGEQQDDITLVIARSVL